MGWLQGWKYRRKITVTEQSGNSLTDYQVKIELNSTNFPDFNECRDDGHDIRFTKDDGETLLNYWREAWNKAGQSATFWVKIPSIPASGSVDIYMYYGNPDATDESDGDATFEFFDDFEGTSLDTTKWTEVGSPSYSVADGMLTLTTDARGEGLKSSLDHGKYRIKMKIKWVSGANWEHGIATCYQDANNFYSTFPSDNNNTFRISKRVGGTLSDIVTTGYAPVKNRWTTLQLIIKNPSTGEFKAILDDEDGNHRELSATNTSLSSGKIGIVTWAGTAETSDIDFFIVRKYEEPEPTVSVSTSKEAGVALEAGVGVAASPSVQQSLTISLEAAVKVGSYALCGFKLPYPGLLAAVIIGDELMDARLRLADGGACDFELWLNDGDGKLARDCRPGSRIDFFVDCMMPPYTRRLIGVIEEATIRRPSRNERVLVIRGRDLWHVIASNQYVVDSYKDAEISEIVRDLVRKYAPEVDVSGVQSTGIVLDDIRFPYRTLKECLDLLASLAGYEYYVDPDLTLHFHPKGVKSSEITYTESEIKPTPEVIDDLTPVKNVVYVLGGVDLKVDQAQESTDGGHTNLHDRWLAQSFTPTRSNLEQVSLYLERVGNPTEDLTGEIREDANGPAGDVVYAFTISRSYIGEAGWKPITAQANLITGRKYWIVLRKVGDAENTYRWYHDGASTGENAYSMDGSTWTVQQNSHSFAFKTYYGLPIIYEASDDISVENYRRREVVIQDPAIRDMATARRVAKAKLEELRNVRRELPRITIAEPKAIPEPGKTVYIKMPSAGIDAEYLVKEVELRFRRGPLPEMKLTLGERRETLEAVLAEALLDLRRQKVGTTGLDKKTTLILYKALSETAKLTDEASATTHDTFTIGSSAIGGDDRVG